MNDHNGYVGRQIGNYRLVEKVGSGGFGSVYRAEHVLIDRVVAVKLLLKLRFSSEVELESFIREARVLEKLQHPHILHLLDVGIEEELLYIITDFAAGGSLEGYLQRQPSRALPLATALPILSQIGEAIQFAHEQSIVHRDLKPGNILFDAHNQVLLADFGIATFITERNLKHTVNIVGSPPYMAPELFDGDIRKECDQYALACVAYELLTGRNLFDLPRNALAMVWAKRHMEEKPIPPTKFNPNIPFHIEQAILKALAKQHDDRFPDVKAFISALTAFSSQTTSPFIHQPNKHTMPPTKFPSTPETSSSSVLHKTIEQWVNEGEVHYKAGRYEEALTCLDQALDLDSKSAQNYYLKGKVLLQLERFSEAIAAFNEATFLKDKFAEAYISKGDIFYYHFGNKKDALESYRHATRVAPRSAPGYYKQGMVLEDQALYTEAIDAYNTALRFEPRAVEIYIRKGHLLERLHRYEEALVTYSDAIQSAPRSTDAYIKKGELFERLRRHEEALTVWEQIILLEPRSTGAYYRKANLLEQLDQHEDALPVWEQIISLEPRSTDAYYRKARILIRFRRYKQALAILDQVIQIDPQADTAYFMKGRTLERLEGNELRYEGGPGLLEAFYDRLFPHQGYRDALKAYNQAIHIQPENSSYYIGKGNVLKRLGRIKEAIDTYEKGIELEEAEKLKEIKEPEKGFQPLNSGNRHNGPGRGNIAVSKSTKNGKKWLADTRSIAVNNYARAYLATLNPLLIPIALGIFLSSWLAFIIALMCIILLIIPFVMFATRLYTQLDAATWLLPAAVAGIGWACIPLLTIPASLVVVKTILIIVSLLVGFLGNAFLYLFLEIYMGILD